MLGFWHLVVLSAIPVLKICFMCSVGTLLARQGILDPGGRRVLSRLIYVLFTPCLTFSKLAPALTPAHLVTWLPLPLNMVLSVAVGLLMGAGLLRLLRPPPGLRPHVMATAGLGNAGNLPLVVVAALIRELQGVPHLTGGITPDTGIAYVAMGIWVATLTHFTIGTALLRQRPGTARDSSGGRDPAQHHQQPHQEHLSAWGAPAAAPPPAGDGKEVDSEVAPLIGGALSSSSWQDEQQQQQQAGRLLSSSSVELAAASSLQGAAAHGLIDPGAGSRGGQDSRAIHHVQLMVQQAAASPSLDEVAHWQEAPHRRPKHDSSSSFAPEHLASDCLAQQQQQQQQPPGGLSTPPISSSSGNRSGWWGRVCGVCQSCGVLLSPPMVGCWLSLVVGSAPPLKGLLWGEAPPLGWVQDCIAMFGDCCIPGLMLLLGATLAAGPGAAGVPARLIVGVTAVRLLLLPAAGTAWIMAAKAIGLLRAPDPMFVLVMLLQNCVPTALNVHTLATLHANREAASAALLFWQYLAALVALPAWLALFLGLAQAYFT